MMRTSKCPRCATLVQYPEGSMPTCPTCGYPGPDPRPVAEPEETWQADQAPDDREASLAQEADGPVDEDDAADESTMDEDDPGFLALEEPAPAPGAATSADAADEASQAPAPRIAERTGPDTPPIHKPTSPAKKRGSRSAVLMDHGNPTQNGKALAGLILGLASYVLLAGGFITAVVAIVMGVQARKEIQRQPELFLGSGVATAAIWLGILFLLLVPAILIILFLTDGLDAVLP